MLIKGIHAVTAALRSGAGKRLIVSSGKLNGRQQAVVDLAASNKCKTEFLSPEAGELDVQGVALEVAAASALGEKDLDQLLETGDSPWLFLVLDGVTDPRNLGACIRSAASFGVHGVIVPRDKSAPLNDAAQKTASGGASLVPVFQVTNLARTLDTLKSANVWVVGTVLDADQPLTSVDLTGSIALVMGAEDTGMRQKTRQRCDFLASIPMPMPDLSLNVSVATGISLYEADRQRSS